MPEDKWVWFAYQADFSEFAVFANEIDCLHYAIDNHMEAEQIPCGVGIRQHINGKS